MTGSNRKRKCRDWEYLCDLDDDAQQESVEVDISVVIQDEEDSKRPRNWVVASALQGGLDSDEHEFAVEIEKAKLERIDEEAYWRRHGDPDAPYSPTRRSSTSSLSSPSIDADAGADDEDDVENVSAYSPGYSASDWSYSSHDDTIVRVCYAALKRERDLEHWSESTFNDACINLLNEYYSREDDKHRLFKASRNVESQMRVISNRTNV
ncbi:expressed unknown protein [Seminavis robusta]|uniref:Uncharacterized protein n=1 Tax=Seminavis robusta TaxID=568900 RepID=A0A9N8ERE5_9STRA|nr:expressed unknown protein [Seminavis robusta]|eukprot:Sro1741_g294700.1 n/a (209) ;mRNA; r:22694-23320